MFNMLYVKNIFIVNQSIFYCQSIVLIVASPNMVSSKLGPRMTTLHEETSNVGNQVSTPINDDDEEKSDADYSEYEAYQVAYILNQKYYLKNAIDPQ